MTLFDDSLNDMLGPWLDSDTADRLLDGLIAPDDAPPGYAGVSRLVMAIRRPPTASELASTDAAVAAAVAALNVVHAEPSTPPRGRRRFLRVKVAGVVFAGSLFGTAGLAAAGVLPEPVQNVAADVLARVGIEVPRSADHPASTGEEISDIATTTDATGIDKGAEISDEASGGISQAGEHGQVDAQGSTSGEHGGSPDETPARDGRSVAGEASGDRSEAAGSRAPGVPGP